MFYDPNRKTMEIVINNDVLLFSATNEETPYEQLQQHRHRHFVGPSRIYKKKTTTTTTTHKDNLRLKRVKRICK